MYRFILALFLAFLSVADLSAKVYPDNGPLFDPSSPKCAVGRPLSEVLDELCAQTVFLDSIGDYLILSTSTSTYAGIYTKGENYTEGIFQWPELANTDTTLYTFKIIHPDRANGSLNDTSIVFGVYFEQGTNNLQRYVKSLWIEYYSIIKNDPENAGYESYVSDQDYLYIEPYISYSHINNLLGQCPRPNNNYIFSNDSIDHLSRWDGVRVTDDKMNHTIRTDINTASALTKNNYIKHFDQCTVTFNHTSHYVGGIKYCPVFEDVYDTLCPKELPGKYNTRLTESGTETVFRGKTWYGADSLVDLHLLVTDKCKKDREIEEVIPDKFLTPDGDGVNDIWNIQNINKYENYVVCIYDRHGKLLQKYNGNFFGWDGIYNGNPQPSTDYWYTITIDELDDELAGHFTLIR